MLDIPSVVVILGARNVKKKIGNIKILQKLRTAKYIKFK